MSVQYCDLRSTLHPDGADVVQSTLLDIAALSSELHTLPLEILLLKHSHLGRLNDSYLIVPLHRAGMITNQLHAFCWCTEEQVITLKKGAMAFPEWTKGFIIGDLVVLDILTPDRGNNTKTISSILDDVHYFCQCSFINGIKHL